MIEILQPTLPFSYSINSMKIKFSFLKQILFYYFQQNNDERL